MNEMTCGGCGGPLDDPPPRCPTCQPDTVAEQAEADRESLRRLLAEEQERLIAALRERDAAEARAEALRGAIEQAPHPVKCASHNRVSPCDCWKARALAAGKTTTTEDKGNG